MMPAEFSCVTVCTNMTVHSIWRDDRANSCTVSVKSSLSDLLQIHIYISASNKHTQHTHDTQTQLTCYKNCCTHTHTHTHFTCHIGCIVGHRGHPSIDY